jgi:hypothetical protein
VANQHAETLGNRLYRILNASKDALYEQGEFAQLTYTAFEIVALSLEPRPADEKIKLTIPIGVRPDRRVIEIDKEYTKGELLQRYQALAFHHLAINQTVRIVTIIEALLSDVIRSVVLRYPKKIGNKKTLTMQVVLEAASIEDIHLRATDSLLNDLTYKSPKEFAEAVNDLLSINLFECPAFHRYLEIKATRDIHLHNGSIANDTYVRKAGTHARVRAGQLLPCDVAYFLDAYEVCLQLIEWLQPALFEQWPSSDFEERQKQPELPLEFSPAALMTTPSPAMHDEDAEEAFPGEDEIPEEADVNGLLSEDPD